MAMIFVYSSPSWVQRMLIRADSMVEADGRLKLFLSNNPHYGADWEMFQSVSESVENLWFVNPW
jgi:hypothetical protein